MIGEQIQVEWAVSPAPIIKKIEERIINRIVKPTLEALKRYKNPYRFSLCGAYDCESKSISHRI